MPGSESHSKKTTSVGIGGLGWDATLEPNSVCSGSPSKGSRLRWPLRGHPARSFLVRSLASLTYPALRSSLTQQCWVTAVTFNCSRGGVAGGVAGTPRPGFREAQPVGSSVDFQPATLSRSPHVAMLHKAACLRLPCQAG